jgi:hypothetical protein
MLLRDLKSTTISANASADKQSENLISKQILTTGQNETLTNKSSSLKCRVLFGLNLVDGEGYPLPNIQESFYYLKINDKEKYQKFFMSIALQYLAVGVCEEIFGKLRYSLTEKLELVNMSKSAYYRWLAIFKKSESYNNTAFE